MVFQQFHLFPHMSVLENVLAGPLYVLGRSRDEAEAEARQLLERVGLADKLAAMPDQLSGGQQQRVAIARALAMKPEAILFDEPTSALDPRMAAEVISVITDLAKSGQTMIVVTHAMGFARNVSHTVHVMHAGRVAESGPPARSSRTRARRSRGHSWRRRRRIECSYYTGGRLQIRGDASSMLLPGRIAHVERCAALRPVDFRFNCDAGALQMRTPRRDILLAHGESQVARAVRAVQRQRCSGNGGFDLARVLRIEHQHHAVAAAKEHMPAVFTRMELQTDDLV